MKKKSFLLLFLCMLCGVNLYADDDATYQINIQHVLNGGSHSEYYEPADMPEVYIDTDNLEFIIEADGFADYYIVNIISQVSMQSVIYTQIGGYGDSINISSLPDAYYRIVIQSSNNNVYEGYFLWEQE